MDGGSSVDRRRRPALLVLLTLAAALGLGTAALLEAPPRQPDWTFPPTGAFVEPPDASPSSAPSPAAVASPSPTATPEPWAPLELPAYTPIARLVATSADPAGVALDTAFRLTATGLVSAATLASALTVEPALAFRIAAGPTGDVTLRPTAALTPGTSYRFTAHAPDGSLAGSWSFRAVAPLHVAATVPGDRQSGVPLDTGIEVTFDQDGVTGVDAHVAIRPATDGHFEQHGRTFAFLPTKPLTPRTIYTVTVSHGVAIPGSAARLESDVTFRFETADPAVNSWSSEAFARPVTESSPAVAPLLTLRGADPAKRVTLDVFRYPTLTAAARAAATLATANPWTMWSDPDRLPSAGLTRVLRATVQPVRIAGDQVGDVTLTLPRPLPAGWYLVQKVVSEGRAPQAILQVTDVATYTLLTATDSLVWVNDIASRGPLQGTTVALLDGPTLGFTGADGLLRTRLPAAIAETLARERTEPTRPSPAPILVATAPDGRAAFVPVVADAPWGIYNAYYGWIDPRADAWWHMLSTDRTAFRSTDTITAWGYLRPRIAAAPPSSATVRLVAATDWWSAMSASVPSVASATARPDATGAFSVPLAVTDLPLGEYQLQLVVDGTVVDRSWLRVDVIRKPSWELEVTTDRHVYFEGETATITVRAAFFDRTPVPGVSVRLNAWSTETLTTGTDGRVATTQTVTVDTGTYNGSSSSGISATAIGGAEGRVWGGANVLTFRGSRTIGTAVGTATATRAAVAGTVNAVDVARLERDFDSVTWETNPAGAPQPGAQVAYTVIQSVPVVRRTHVAYDFIEKKVVRIPEWTNEDRTLRTGTVVADRTGHFAMSFALPSWSSSPVPTYRVELRVADEAGKVMERSVYLPDPNQVNPGSMIPHFLEDPGCAAETSACHDGYRDGDAATRTIASGNRVLPSGAPNRYLFATVQGGLRDWTISSSPTYRRTFGIADAPNLGLTGVSFTGAGYLVAAPTDLTFDRRSMSLDVRLTTDRASYEPGDTVRLGIETRDSSGRLVPASVAVRVIDEKLYASGQAYEDDPLEALYRHVAWGILGAYASHPVPFGNWGGGMGDATGGGGRGDFRDFLVARLVTTGSDGKASLSFALSDDLTAWHASATAMTADVRAGHASVLIPVGLPFFVDAAVAPEYLVGERPTLRLFAYGSSLTTGDPVTFTVSSPTLPLAATSVAGVAFTASTVDLPALPGGTQTIRIAATSGGARGARSDAVIRTFEVVQSRLTTARTTYETMAAGTHPAGGAGWTSYVFVDAGRGRWLPLLESVAWSSSARADAGAAAQIARTALQTTFAVPASGLPATSFDPLRYQHEEAPASLLPYSSPDLELTGRLAALAPEPFEGSTLRTALQTALRDASTTREQRAYVLAGLAGLGVDVLGAVRAALSASDLTVRERLLLALAASNGGDVETAVTVERALLSAYGQRLGRMARLTVGSSLDDTIEATALVAVVAAAVGDPLATDLLLYVEREQPNNVLVTLEATVAALRLVERTPAAPASFAYTVDGVRRVVKLSGGRAMSLRLTAAQRATLAFEPLIGNVGVATTWSAPVPIGGIATDPSVSIRRDSTRSGPIATDEVVEVLLTATFSPQALGGAYEVTELVPSGLAPLTFTEAWLQEGSELERPSYIAPYAIDGQVVRFSVWRQQDVPIPTMRYLARVVTPGTYAWEPAVLQSSDAPEVTAVTAAGTAAIR